MEDAFFTGVANNGFGVFVAGYLLWQLNKNVTRLVDWVVKWEVKVNMSVSVKEKKEDDEV